MSWLIFGLLIAALASLLACWWPLSIAANRAAATMLAGNLLLFCWVCSTEGHRRVIIEHRYDVGEQSAAVRYLSNLITNEVQRGEEEN